MKHLTTILCLTLTILLGSVGNSESADLQKGLTAYKSGDYATALREWTPLAKQGDAHAQNNLGLMYKNGQGVPQDDMNRTGFPGGILFQELGSDIIVF
jgi:TPR repeat protein